MRIVHLLPALLILAACATPCPDCSPAGEPDIQLGAAWAEVTAEYQAISAQVYAQARRDLPRLLADSEWTAVPGQKDVASKPPAVIFDIDETVLSNAGYQHTLRHTPYSPFGHFDWLRSNEATPIRGAADMVSAARMAGVEVFFVTNRACAVYEGIDGDCPDEQVTIDDLREGGIEADAEHVMLAAEQPAWTKEKLHRRMHVAETHRVIMLFGDDYGDFVQCTRAKPLEPCTEPATRASRHAALDTYADYWGNGWYILPNPMYGSWTTVR
jgi:acid phosphatase